MKIIDNLQFEFNECKNIHFIRVEIEDLNETILNIIESLNDLSWINKFDDEYTKACFLARAIPTAKVLSKQLTENCSDQITQETGEYVVSEISRKSIIEKLNYLSIPIAELLGRKKKGNPGFDFFTVNDTNIIIFGEAKYVASQNAYGRGLCQIAEFINQKKDIADLKLIEDFCNKDSLNNVINGKKGFAVGFSAKHETTEALINNIKRNRDFLKLLQYEEIIIVAVNI